MAASQTLEANAVANGAGVASVTFQAPNVGARGLQVVSIALKVTGSSKIPTATAYKGVITPTNTLAKKTAGDRGTFVGQDDVLFMGEQLSVVWEGVTPGAVCYATLRGSAVASG